MVPTVTVSSGAVARQAAPLFYGLDFQQDPIKSSLPGPAGLGRGRVKARITTLRLRPQLFILGGKDVLFLFRISRLLQSPLESAS